MLSGCLNWCQDQDGVVAGDVGSTLFSSTFLFFYFEVGFNLRVYGTSTLMASVNHRE